MELNRDQIIKALECLTGEEVMYCRECGYNSVGAFSCRKKLAKDALTLIKELTEENKVRKGLNTMLNNELRKLGEENERLRATRYFAHPDGRIEIIPTAETVKADTVRKMRERIKAEKFHHKNFGDLVYLADIDQIAKEMINDGEKENRTN